MTNTEPFYLVRNDYGPRLGQAFVECEPAAADWNETIRLLARGEWDKPVQVVEVNLADCTSRDVTALAFETACEARRRAGWPAPAWLVL